MSTNPIRLLLIDDQPIVAAAIRRLLAPAPEFEIYYCQNSANAETEAKACTIVLIDLVMPGISGLETIRRLRANPDTDNLPLVVLSSNEVADLKVEAFTAGADDYMIKLPEGREMIARLHALLRRCNR